MHKKTIIKVLAASLLLSGGITLSADKAYAAELDNEVVVGEETVLDESPVLNESDAVPINEEFFPDALFRKYISKSIDKDQDGVLSKEEIESVTQIAYHEPEYDEITSLKGIEVFKNLEILSINSSKTKELDLSGNKELNLIEIFYTELTALDVTMLPNLKYLTINYSKLKELDLSGNPNLEFLDCSFNQLNNLDLSANKKLNNLLCLKNDFKSLNITPCPQLVRAYEFGRAYEFDLGALEEGVFIDYEGHFVEPAGGQLRVTKGVEIIDSPFTDLKHGAWYVPAVNFVKENGFMTGTSDTTFKPDALLTRSQFVKVLYNVEGMPKVEASNVFDDVTEGEWYADAVAWAAANKITSGVGEKKFGTDLEITREQLATLLYNYASTKDEYNLDKDMNLSEVFPDADQVDDWAADGMKWAVVNRIMSGKKGSGDKNYLDPRGKATRAECAQMIENLKEKAVK